MKSKPITSIAKMRTSENSVAKSNGLVEGAAKVYGSGKTRTITIPGTETKSGYDGPMMSAEEWAKLSPEERRSLNAKAGANEKGEIITTTPDQTVTETTPGYEETLKTIDKGTVSSTMGYRKNERKIRKGGNDYFKELRSSGMSRKEAKAKANAWEAEQRGNLRKRLEQEISSGKGKGESYITGQRDMYQGEMSTEEQRRMFEERNAANQGKTDYSKIFKKLGEEVGMTENVGIGNNNASGALSFKDRMSNISFNADRTAKNTDLLNPKSQQGIRGRNAALDFASNITNQDFSNAPYTAYVDKTGSYRDNFLEDKMNNNSMANKKGTVAYKMGGFMSKANKKK